MNNKRLLFIIILGLFLTFGAVGTAKAICNCWCSPIKIDKNLNLTDEATYKNIKDVAACENICGERLPVVCKDIVGGQTETLEPCVCANGKKAENLTKAECEAACLIEETTTSGGQQSGGSASGSNQTGGSTGDVKTTTNDSGSGLKTQPVGDGAGSGLKTESPQTQTESGSLENPLGKNVTSVEQIAGKIIKVIISLLGIISLCMFIFAGFTWLTAGGRPDAVKKGKETMIWAVAGLAVVFSSYIVLKFVFRILSDF